MQVSNVLPFSPQNDSRRRYSAGRRSPFLRAMQPLYGPLVLEDLASSKKQIHRPKDSQRSLNVPEVQQETVEHCRF